MPNKPSQLAVASGERLRLTREALELSSGEFASKLGVSISRLSNWEAGTSLIGPAWVLKARERFKVTTDWIYAGDPQALPKWMADKVTVPHIVPTPVPTRKRKGAA